MQHWLVHRFSQAMGYIVPLFFIVAVCILGYYGQHAIHDLNFSNSASAPASKTPLTIEELKTRLDDLKWILGFIVGAAAFFAIIQAAISFFNAQTFTKQADDAVKRIEAIAKDTEQRFPMFAAIEEARRETYAALALLFPSEGLDWEDRMYAKMPLSKRQRVLSVENFIAIEFVPHTGNPSQYAANLRRLANFYASKYVYESKHHQADIDRAEYYLNLALRETGDAFYLLNDLGVLHMELRATPDLGKAKEYFENALDKRGAQQRARYNLGVLAAREQRWQNAEACYKEALKYDAWELAPISEMKCNILYNLGCSRARLHYAAHDAGDANGARRLLDECVDTLKQAAAIGGMESETVDRDLDDAAVGDLYRLTNEGDTNTIAELNRLRTELTIPKTRMQKNWKARWDRAVESLRGEY